MLLFIGYSFRVYTSVDQCCLLVLFYAAVYYTVCTVLEALDEK